MMSQQKKILFCDGSVFFIDRCLLMGALTEITFQFDFIEDLVAPSKIFRVLILQRKRQKLA